MLPQNHAVHVKIFSARTDVEPLSVVHHQAADLATVTNPIRKNRNEGDFLPLRDPLENLRIPNGDISKIDVSSGAVAIREIHNAVITEGHVRSQAGVTQRQRNVVATTEMFVNQSFQ